MNLKERIVENLNADDVVNHWGETVDVCQELMHEENPWSTWDWQTKTGNENQSFADDVTMEMVEHRGGEGQGDIYYTIWSFTDGNETHYVRFNGWYASYSGSEYQDYDFVEPYERTITDWRTV